MHILKAVYRDDAPPALRELRSVQVLRQVWVQQYWQDGFGQLRWRAAKSTRNRASRRATEQRNTGKSSADGRPDPTSARVPWSTMEIVTPHDPKARYSQKVTAAGQRDWIGCRDDQTETCDETSPHVIVQVITRPAPQQDIDALDDIHQRLTRQGFQPLEHVVDGGYVTPDSIHQAFQKWDIHLLGPVRADRQAALSVDQWPTPRPMVSRHLGVVREEASPEHTEAIRVWSWRARPLRGRPVRCHD